MLFFKQINVLLNLKSNSAVLMIEEKALPSWEVDGNKNTFFKLNVNDKYLPKISNSRNKIL